MDQRARTALILVLSAVACDRAHPRTSLLTTVEQVRRLDPDEAQRRRAVHLRGVVTLHDGVAQRLVLQDPTGGISVDISNLKIPSYQGEAVELDAVTSRGDRAPLLVNASIKKIGPGQIPEPRQVSMRELGSGRADDQWVEVRGVVRNAHSAIAPRDGALALDVVADGGSFTAIIDHSSGIVFSSVVDATVRLRGVATSTFGVRGEVIRSGLLIPSREQISVVEPVAADPYSIAARSIGSLVHVPADGAPAHRVRIRGQVVAEDPSEGLLVRDATGELPVRPARMIPVRPGDEVDVLGFVRPDQSAPVLDDVSLRRVTAEEPPAITPAPRPAAAGHASRILTSTRQVQNLSVREAAQGYPVRLEAVVTYSDPDWRILFVQDSTGGIFVDMNGEPATGVKAGDRIVLDGVVDPGGFAPQINHPRIRVVGRGAMPPANLVSPEQMFTGRLDSQWVEAEGIVQSTRQDRNRAFIDIAAGLYRFTVQTPTTPDPSVLRQLVDARVRVRGACGTVFNEGRQLVGVQIHIPDLSYLSVQERGAADPFSIPPRSVASLLRFNLEDAPGHRVLLQGVTTLRRQEGLFLQDRTGGLFVQTDDATSLQPGDRVEAVGFAVPGEYAPILRDAIIRKVKAGPLPTTTTITAADAATGEFDAHLVRLEAYLLDRTVNSREQVLTLQAGKSVFNAVLPQDKGDPLSSVRVGSLLQLTGVCAVQADTSRAAPIARSFRLLLRSADDLVVVESAPWWTLRHTLWAASAMSVVIVAVLAWVGLLRKRVRVQTEVIRRSQRELLTSEKMASLGRLTAGIAHEMNTPLAAVRAALFELTKLADEYGASIGDSSVTPHDHQEISAEMQRTAALAEKAAEKAAGFLRGVRSQTRETGLQDGGRFQARPVIEEALMLLGHAARSAKCKIEFQHSGEVELQGVPGRLSQVVTNLVSNALDASVGREGGRVSLQLSANASGAHLSVSDSGSGITPEILPRIFEPLFTSKPFGEGTGLGLSIVHDIVTGYFGGEIKVQSKVGVGTTFDVTLPRPPHSPAPAMAVVGVGAAA